MNISTITISEKRRYYWSSAISIIFNHTLPSHEGNYTCISIAGNLKFSPKKLFIKNITYLLNVTGKDMQISILVCLSACF